MRVTYVKWKQLVLTKLSVPDEYLYERITAEDITLRDGEVIAANTLLSHEIMVKLAEGGVKAVQHSVHQ